ncbi:MAG: CFI-box-CTERM domain-containing protein [Polyangiales bacterium]
MRVARYSWILVAASCIAAASTRAQDMPGVVLELKLTPAPRAQIAVWLEDGAGRFIRTLQLTEAVAFHGIGNRPGASEFNSGYRWPYGRREGALPIWAARRAAAPGAKSWKRVIFQNRTWEGLASRTSSDQSPDSYYCLSFNQAGSTKAALDAMTCASVFSSDKGRFLTAADMSAGYAEPWEDPTTHKGTMQPLPLMSLYPPRMDVTRCSDTSCFDHADVASYAAHARDVMPEIDAVSMATPPGNVEQSLLFSLPPTWPQGKYVLWLEINVEGDYNSTYDATTYPTPSQPSGKWDSWATTYGYAYRGQPSVVFQVPFELSAQGTSDYDTAAPSGRSSWDFWAPDYGTVETPSNITDDPKSAPGSGADRLRSDAKGNRLSLDVRTLADLPVADPTQPLPMIPISTTSGTPPSTGTNPSSSSGGSTPTAGAAGAPAATPVPSNAQRDPQTDAIILQQAQSSSGPVGVIHGLALGRYPNVLHAHDWITIRFQAASSEQPIHAYDVRVANDPIVDEASFIANGRPARTASDDPEGAVALMLPTDAAAGKPVESAIGDLVAMTHYYVAVRATDELNRSGPISVAEITTQKRTFATVTPCFVASAAYGSPLAEEVSVLRRLRDRHLMTNALGRELVRRYYRQGAGAAQVVRNHDTVRSVVRALLEPVVTAARWAASL